MISAPKVTTPNLMLGQCVTIHEFTGGLGYLRLEGNLVDDAVEEERCHLNSNQRSLLATAPTFK